MYTHHIPIALAFDRNYRIPAAVAIRSLLTCLQHAKEHLSYP
ncbi:hypothetical protein [Helicobacter cynogastricus]|nr:hypothetical protein [Helicobacter cynogastricus]